MRSIITVHPGFEASWPWVADALHARWQAHGPVEFIRTLPGDNRTVSALIDQPETVTRLIVLGTPITPTCEKSLGGLQEAALYEGHGPAEIAQRFRDRGVKIYAHSNEGYWGQSVAEYALALTLSGLRRLPQLHQSITQDISAWDYAPIDGVGRPGQRGYQYGDDPRFVNGTLAGKRVRIVGLGNVASRYAAFAQTIGADIAAWDPYKTPTDFEKAGARQAADLDHLMKDAEIFAPIIPLTTDTEGLITTKLIDALPRGCLVVLVTRAMVCDMKAIRRRVLADELALAADVFDLEPLPLKDPLLGRHNVVHTPHHAGRTKDANIAWAERLSDLFT